MKRVKTAAFLAIIFLLSGIAMAGEYQVTKKVDGFDVAVTLDKNPPVAGKNMMTVVVKDDAGKPVNHIELIRNGATENFRLPKNFSKKCNRPLREVSCCTVKGEGCLSPAHRGRATR